MSRMIRFKESSRKESTVYYSQLLGYNDESKHGWPCLLNKTIYDLKQSTKVLVLKIKLFNFLLLNNFTNSLVDTSLFTYDNILIWIVIYVDNIIITENNIRILLEICVLN